MYFLAIHIFTVIFRKVVSIRMYNNNNFKSSTKYFSIRMICFALNNPVVRSRIQSFIIRILTLPTDITIIWDQKLNQDQQIQVSTKQKIGYGSVFFGLK